MYGIKWQYSSNLKKSPIESKALKNLPDWRECAEDIVKKNITEELSNKK